jgi:hypothetical protein
MRAMVFACAPANRIQGVGDDDARGRLAALYVNGSIFLYEAIARCIYVCVVLWQQPSTCTCMCMNMCMSDKPLGDGRVFVILCTAVSVMIYISIKKMQCFLRTVYKRCRVAVAQAGSVCHTQPVLRGSSVKDVLARRVAGKQAKLGKTEDTRLLSRAAIFLSSA